MKPHRTHPPYCSCIDCSTRPERPAKGHSRITPTQRRNWGLLPQNFGEPPEVTAARHESGAQQRARTSATFLTSGVWQVLEKVRL